MELSLSTLRNKNAERALIWTKGEPRGIEFSAIEFIGEAGELMNKIKKYLRLKADMPGGEFNQEELEDEVADCLLTLDLVAMSLNIDLAQVTIKKFNKDSSKHNIDVYID